MSTHVDNLLIAGHNFFGSIYILDDMEGFLASQWDQKLQPTSRWCKASCSVSDTSVTDESKWPLVTSMGVLGHYVEHDGGTMLESPFRQLCLQAFWAARKSAKLTVLNLIVLNVFVCYEYLANMAALE